jgi:ferredoxin
MMTPFIGAICNCQPGDCLGLRTLALDVETMFRDESVAAVNEELCIGCGACEDACQFQAISGGQAGAGFKAMINREKCFGCGLCRNACPQEALTMVGREQE